MSQPVQASFSQSEEVFYYRFLLLPDFYGDLVYKLKKIVGSNNFSAQFI